MTSEVISRVTHRCFEITEASEITVTPDQVIVVRKPKDSEALLQNYRRNVWWFLALVALSSAWFYRHFETYFSQALVVGVPLTYAIWQVIFSYWKSFWQSNAKELRRKWLSQKSATLQLAGLCAGVFLFLLCTTSVWVSLAPGGTSAATLEVRHQGKRFMPRIELAETSRIGGRLYFPRFIRREVEIVVTSPARWEINGLRSRTLWPWTALNLNFPDNFHQLPQRALRIVPGTSLHDDVDQKGSLYTLTIQEGNYAPKQSPNFAFQTFYVGLSQQAELRASYAKHNAGWADHLERSLIVEGLRPENAKKYASLWASGAVLAHMHDFGDGSTVRVTLGIPGQPPIAIGTKILTEEVNTLFLEKTP